MAEHGRRPAGRLAALKVYLTAGALCVVSFVFRTKEWDK